MDLRRFALGFTLLAAAAVPAFGSDGVHYVAAMSAYRCNPYLTYDRAVSDPSEYIGKVFELRGKVGGVASSAHGLSVMLSLQNGQAVVLTVPQSEAALMRGCDAPEVRALVRVGQGGTGNVLPLQVLCVARESEVSVVESQQAYRSAVAKQAAAYRLLERRQWREQALRSMAGRQPVNSPSRGGYRRSLPSNASVTEIANYYQTYLGPRTKPIFMPYFRFIYARNQKLGIAESGEIAYHLLNFADRYNVDPVLVVCMIIAESDFNPWARSRTGAMGLGQLMPATARALGCSDPYDPVQNLDGSIRYLRN
ncbi:MAG TPA: lytic transglycosylase domain-containing protein, partial [Chthonomonadales bacterium]|nr:lytic transglycosylase domain-containing protein [Chthonomonadales bacterium]